MPYKASAMSGRLSGRSDSTAIGKRVLSQSMPCAVIAPKMSSESRTVRLNLAATATRGYRASPIASTALQAWSMDPSQSLPSQSLSERLTSLETFTPERLSVSPGSGGRPGELVSGLRVDEPERAFEQ